MNKRILEKNFKKVYFKYEKKLKSGGMSILVENETGDLINDEVKVTQI